MIEFLPASRLASRRCVHLVNGDTPHCVPHRNQMTDSRGRLAGQVSQRTENIILSDANHALVKTVGIRLDEIRRGNGLLKSWLCDLLSLD